MLLTKWFSHLSAPPFFALILLLSPPAHSKVEIESWQTSNGAKVYFVAAPQLPMVDIRVTFDAGSARDDKHLGLAQLTNAMIGEGAQLNGQKLDTDEIAERFDAVGANVSSSSLRDMATISFRSLTEPRRLTPALATLKAIIGRPTFPSAALERVRNQQLVSLRYDEQSPGTIARNAYYTSLYGNHPYATPSSGTLESVAALTRSDLLRFYRRYYVARNATVAIVGKLNRAEAKRVAEELIGPLPSGAAAPRLPPVDSLNRAIVRRLQHPSTQTHLLMGQPGVHRGDPDYFPLYVGNHILGGSGLISRIGDEVREKRGLAYSAYSYFSPMREAGPFTLGLQTRNDQIEQAEGIMAETLTAYLNKGPSAAELAAAKSNIVGGFALKIDSNKDIVGYLNMIGFYHLPLDYLDRFTVRVEAVTLEQISEAFRRRIDPKAMVTVTVGGKE